MNFKKKAKLLMSLPGFVFIFLSKLSETDASKVSRCAAQLEKTGELLNSNNRLIKVREIPIVELKKNLSDPEVPPDGNWREVIHHEDYSISMQSPPKLLPHDSQLGLVFPMALEPMEPNDPKFQAVERIIQISSSAMSQRRGWSDEFMNDRIHIAKKHAPRSWYFFPANGGKVNLSEIQFIALLQCTVETSST